MVTQLRQSSSLSNVLYNTGECAKSSQWPLMLSNGSYIDTVSDLTQVLANGNNALWNVWKANTCFSAICRNNTVLVTDKIKQNRFWKPLIWTHQMTLSTLEFTRDEAAFCTVEKSPHPPSFQIWKQYNCVGCERSVTLSWDGGILQGLPPTTEAFELHLITQPANALSSLILWIHHLLFTGS